MQRNTTTTTITALALLMTACKYLPGPNGNGETGGEDSYEHDPEGPWPPQWWCRERLDAIGHEDSDIETCYYSHATQGWDWKPHWGGMPSVMQWVDDMDLPFVADSDNMPQHPLYTCVSSWLDNHPDAVKFIRNMERDDFRSGLIGNFALWLPVELDGDLRWSPGIGDVQPPIITATFFDVSNPELPTMAGNPYMSGRYNAYGQPCSTVPPDLTASWWNGCQANPILANSVTIAGHDPNVDVKHADCQALVAAYGVSAVAPGIGLPDVGNVPGATHVGPVYWSAIETTRCLDNGGSHHFGAAAASAGDREGLVWVNWSQETIAAMHEYVQLHLLPLDALVEDLVVLLDFIAGGEHGSQEAMHWPDDPAYPYQSWSHTGTCYFGASVETYHINGQSLRSTRRGCPAHMMAILPDLPDETGVVDGFCTYPHIINAPPSGGAAIPGAEPGFSKGLIGHGRYYHYLDLRVLTDDVLSSWIDGFMATPSPNGMLIKFRSPAGRRVLASLEIPDGSRLLSVGDLLVAPALADEPERAVSTTEVALEVNRLVSERKMIHMVLEAPDGTWINRYLSTYTDAGAVTEPPTVID